MNLDIHIENYLRLQWHEMLMVLISTIILFLLARKFFWNSIAAFVNARKEFIAKSLNDASEKEKNAEMILQQRNKELEEARQHANVIIDFAKKEASLTSEKMINEAKLEAERRIQKASEDIQQERENVERHLRQEIIDVAFVAAEKIVEKQINKEEYQEDVTELVDKAGVS